MSTRLYTYAELNSLQLMPKRIINSTARWVKKPKGRPVHRQRTLKVLGQRDGEEYAFTIYQRQSIAEANDFSCGITYHPFNGLSLTLARYNGSSHEHGDIAYRPHIHRATEEAIAAGRKPESEAKETNRFNTMKGALACLIVDFNLEGLHAQFYQLELFS